MQRCPGELREAEGAATISTFSWPQWWSLRATPNQIPKEKPWRTCPVAGSGGCCKCRWFLDSRPQAPHLPGDHQQGRCSLCPALQRRELPFVDCALISLALCITISIKTQTYFGIFIPITQVRKPRHEVTCSKSHLQLVSDLGFKLKDSPWLGGSGGQSIIPCTKRLRV